MQGKFPISVQYHWQKNCTSRVDVKEITLHSMVIFLEVAAEVLGTLMDRIPCFKLAFTLC